MAEGIRWRTADEDLGPQSGGPSAVSGGDAQGDADLDAALEDLLTREALLHRRDVEHLERALASSRQIGVALGIIMSRDLLTRDQAFERLRKVARDSNRKLRDVAVDVEHTGILPGVDDAGVDPASIDLTSVERSDTASPANRDTEADRGRASSCQTDPLC